MTASHREHLTGTVTTMRGAARLCWAIDRNDWLIAVANVVAGVTFVLGCVAFFSPALYVPGVSLFLVGSVLMLAAACADAFRRYGPSS